MKICQIINEADSNRRIGFILYYEDESEFVIEIDPDLDSLHAPISLDSFVRDGHPTVEPEWSRRWVEQRIPPVDRQNIQSILSNNRLKGYDAYKLLIISSGRCAQDSCAVQEIRHTGDTLPEWLSQRLSNRIEYVHVLDGSTLLLIYSGGAIIRSDLMQFETLPDKMELIIERPDLFKEAKRGTGGYGVEWPGGTFIFADDLLRHGDVLPVSKNNLTSFLQGYLIDTAEACRQLSCSRQYISKLVEAGSLTPLLQSGTRIFAQGDISRFKE